MAHFDEAGGRALLSYEKMDSFWERKFCQVFYTQTV